MPGLNIFYGIIRIPTCAVCKDSMYQMFDTLIAIIAGTIGIAVTAVQCHYFFFKLLIIASEFWTNFFTFALKMIIGMIFQCLVIGIGSMVLTIAYEPHKFARLTLFKIEDIIYHRLIKHIAFVGAIYSLSRVVIYLAKCQIGKLIWTCLDIIAITFIQIVICVIVTIEKDFDVCK